MKKFFTRATLLFFSFHAHALSFETVDLDVFASYKDMIVDSFYGAYAEQILKQDLESMFVHDLEELQQMTEPITIVAAQENRCTLGFILLYPDHQIKLDPSCLYIRYLVIDPAHQGKGVGTKLIAYIINTMPDLGYLTLFTKKVNTKSISFYEKLGFNQTAILPTTTITGEYDITEYESFELKVTDFVGKS